MESLRHVALPLTVFFDRRITGVDRREEELQRITALLADLVTELEPIDFPRISDQLPITIVTAVRRLSWRNDLLRIFVARLFRIIVFNDVFNNPIGPRIGVLLSDIASDSSQSVSSRLDLLPRSGTTNPTAVARGNVCFFVHPRTHGNQSATRSPMPNPPSGRPYRELPVSGHTKSAMAPR